MKVRVHGRLGLLSAVALAACMHVAAAAGSYEVEDVPLSQIAADLAAGKTTSVEVTQAYIDRIHNYDGPLHAVIGIDPNALKQAAAADKRRKARKTPGAARWRAAAAQGQHRCHWSADHGGLLCAGGQHASQGLLK